MSKIIPCVLCDKPATYSIKPDGGTVSYWCDKHYKQTVKQLNK